MGYGGVDTTEDKIPPTELSKQRRQSWKMGKVEGLLGSWLTDGPASWQAVCVAILPIRLGNSIP